MIERDGIVISDQPTWALSFRELRQILGKRIIALPSKLIGFKPFCLFLATWLLVSEKIDMWVWFLVFVSVLFGVVGLKVATKYREAAGSGGGSGGGIEAIRKMVGGGSDERACGTCASCSETAAGSVANGGGEGQ